MIKFTSALGFFMLSLLPAVGQAVIGEQTYHLAKEDPELPIGRSFLAKERMSGVDAKLSLRLGEDEVDGTMNLAEVKDRIISFPEKDKVRFSFTEVRTKTVIKIDEMPAEVADVVKPLSGKDVLVEKKDGKWVARVEKGEVLEENQDEIRKELESLESFFNENEDAKLYGTEARKIGDKWDVDPRFFPGMGEFEVNGGKLSLHLKEVKKYEGDECAVIEMTFRLKGFSTDPEQKGLEATFSGSARVVRSLTLLTDLKRTMDIRFELAGKTDPDNAGSPMMTVSGDMKMEMRGSPVPVWHSLESKDWRALSFGGEGAAAWDEGVLHLDLGVDLTGVRYEGEIPKIPYEIELEARKVNGNDFFCGLTFPVGSQEECLTFIVGGWGGGTVGISSIGGQDASANETTSYHNFEKDRWYAVKVRVEKETISAFIDGKQVVDLKTTGKKLELRRGIIEICAPLGFAAWQTEAEARKMRWRSLAD